VEFRNAAQARVDLREAISMRRLSVMADPVLEHRSRSLRRALVLQRDLETRHGFSHRRSLRTAVKDAGRSGRFSVDSVHDMLDTVRRGNAARHSRWSSASWTKVSGQTSFGELLIVHRRLTVLCWCPLCRRSRADLLVPVLALRLVAARFALLPECGCITSLEDFDW